jgi:hypothetical protein
MIASGWRDTARQPCFLRNAYGKGPLASREAISIRPLHHHASVLRLPQGPHPPTGAQWPVGSGSRLPSQHIPLWPD